MCKPECSSECMELVQDYVLGYDLRSLHLGRALVGRSRSVAASGRRGKARSVFVLASKQPH